MTPEHSVSAPLSRPDGRRQLVLCLFLTLLVAGYCWTRLDRGWVPHDEGTIAQSAERVLHGEVPHHDFTEVYTGGLSYLHAAAMRVFGMDLTAPRDAVFLLLIGWIPALYYCFTRFVSPPAAAGLVILAAAWSFPVYPAALPSWYILFICTFGVAALLRHVDDPRARWLVLAGVAGGVAMLAKVSGLFYVCAVLPWLAYREGLEGARREQGESSRMWAVLLAAGLLALVAALFMLVRRSLSEGMLLHFVLPAAAMSAVLVAGEWRAPGSPVTTRLKRLMTTAIPFLAGVFLPLALFAIPYLVRGQLGELIYGVFILPSRRVQFAAMAPPGVRTAIAALPLLALALPWRAVGRTRLWLNLGLLGVVLAGLLMLSHDYSLAYAATWLSVRSLGPLVVLIGAVQLVRGRLGREGSAAERERVALVLWIVALMGLLQFPFAAPVYYCYIAPLVLLALVAIRPVHQRAPFALPVIVGAFYLVFALWLVHPGTVYTFGHRYEPDQQVALLRMPRGGLLVMPAEQQVYERVVSLVQEHAKNGVVLATPDAPEISFLADRANPTRSLFEFFDAPLGEQELMALLDRRGVTAVVVNTKPWFSPRMTPEMVDALHRRYPSGEAVGQFLVFW